MFEKPKHESDGPMGHWRKSMVNDLFPGIYVRADLDAWNIDELDRLRRIAQVSDSFLDVMIHFPYRKCSDVADVICYCFGQSYLHYLVENDEAETYGRERLRMIRETAENEI